MKEGEISRDKSDGIRTDARNVTVNDVYDLWRKLKKGLKDNTFQNYMYMYEQFVYEDLGKRKVYDLKPTDVRRFYNRLADENHIKISTIDNVHTVLHQVLDIAVEDNYIRNNPSDHALKELKKTHNFDSDRRKALTVEEHRIFTDFLNTSDQYRHWRPVFTVMLEAGLRVGETTGLRWEDIDITKGIISVNHTLVYYNHAKDGCAFGINTPKTEAGKRIVPMTSAVRAAFIEERKRQMSEGCVCSESIDGFSNFIFINRFGKLHNQASLNRALRRIMRDCNQEQIDKVNAGKIKEKDLILLPKFSCHSLRHTCATRLCESGVNIKVIQEFLGHADITTTMNIYAEATQTFKISEIEKFDSYMSHGPIRNTASC